MKNVWIYLGLLWLFVLPGCPAAAESEILTISGTGDSQFLLQKLAYDFNRTRSDIRVVIPNSIGSGGGIQALLAGKIPLARTARPLKEKEQGHGLIAYRFVESPVAFVTHPSVDGIDNLTGEQIIGIYSGQYRRWNELGGPDAKIYPVDREAGDSSRVVIEKSLPGFKGLLSRGKVFYTTPETMHAIEGHPHTIGYLPLNIALNSGLKVIRFEGVSPLEYVTSQSDYPFVVPFFLVSKGELPYAAVQFLRFLSTDKVRRRLQAEAVRPMP